MTKNKTTHIYLFLCCILLFHGSVASHGLSFLPSRSSWTFSALCFSSMSNANGNTSPWQPSLSSNILVHILHNGRVEPVQIFTIPASPSRASLLPGKLGITRDALPPADTLTLPAEASYIRRVHCIPRSTYVCKMFSVMCG